MSDFEISLLIDRYLNYLPDGFCKDDKTAVYQIMRPLLKLTIEIKNETREQVKKEMIEYFRSYK